MPHPPRNSPAPHESWRARYSSMSRGVILLDVLGGDAEELGPPTVPVDAVLAGKRRDAAVQDLHGLEGLAVVLDAGIDEVRARPVAPRHLEVVQSLGVNGLQNVELPRHHDEAVAQGSGRFGVEHASLGDGHLYDVRVAVVKEDGRVEGHDQENPGEHLEHPLVQEEVHRPRDLAVGPRPVEVQGVALAPHRQLQLYRAVPQAVVVGVVLELEPLALGDVIADQLDHAPARPVQ